MHLREKTLWRMLYETCARAEEILGINIEELDLAGRRTPVKAVSPRDVCRTLGWPGFRTGRPARYWTSTRPSEGRRAPAGTCTSGGTPA